MKIDRVIVGELETNCYVLKQNNECLVIDPGAEYNKIKEAIDKSKVLGVIVTHSHFDHIGALSNFEEEIIYDINKLEEKEYKIGCFNFDIIYTPGHKEDSITIYFRKEKVMFTGDFLFKGTIGRTDLPGSDHKKMIDSLNKISKYDKDIEIYPGHGKSTYLRDEVDLIKYLC